jgi:tRNA-splicing ligase RtcB
MIELKGKHNTAKVFTDNIDDVTIGQVIELCNQEFVSGLDIRIMSDCHAGAGCVIGTTMTITDKIVPNLVGVDIGCGMEVVQLSNKDVDLEKLDKVVHTHIPSGFSIRASAHRYAREIDFGSIHAEYNKERAVNSIGTLGGGNHFIELDKDDNGNYYLVIHSGSRNMGKQIAEYWQKVATAKLKDDYNKTKGSAFTIATDKRMIEELLLAIPKPPTESLSYLYGGNFDMYLHDMNIAQKFASVNRKAMADVIIGNMDFQVVDQFTTIHNYIDMGSMILRKGAVSAKTGERLIIPINMRDGSLIATGKGNQDWNYSAPHGAGRLMGRGQAKRTLNMGDYEASMDGIYTTSVNASTLDEAPMAYKNMDEIIENTKDTISLDMVIRPVYNYKDSGD